ncbi:MAG: Xaa-Pro dipeptidase [Gammaproteobacteria bacterium]|nr:Xaa-Pro dipeptidase [Gammaproteobacteria bacterium]
MSSTDNTPDNAAYVAHLQIIQSRWNDALEAAGFDAALVAAGHARPYFQDDQAPVFRANPHLTQWFNDDNCEHSLLLVATGQRPRLFFYQPEDYWHQPPQAPDRLSPFMDLQLYSDPAKLESAALGAAREINRVAYVGEQIGENQVEGAVANLPVDKLNPSQLLSHLSYQRAYKTEFEVACMRQATAVAVVGHNAAREAFANGAAEFEIQLRYLEASGQTQSDVPYGNIIALNEHASVLHYQHYDRDPPPTHHSFLIDAGARHQCYASDITRSYCAERGERGSETFAALIADLDTAQQELIAGIETGRGYLELHEEMHRRLGQVLANNKLVHCSAEAAFDLGITRSFLPHGLGHLLGLQTHDVGGHLTSPAGGQNPPPDEYSSLRLTRPVETNQVFTIEPGLYFIPQLLRSARESSHAAEVNWVIVEELMPFGGIRIEDNVLITDAGTENLTRDAFARLTTG